MLEERHYENIHDSIIHDIQKLETTQITNVCQQKNG